MARQERLQCRVTKYRLGVVAGTDVVTVHVDLLTALLFYIFFICPSLLVSLSFLSLYTRIPYVIS